MTHAFRIAPAAREHWLESDAWWRNHRPAAPDAVLGDVLSVIESVCAAPSIGTPYAHPALPGLRRVLAKRVGLHVYYVEGGHEVVVVAIWNASAGVGPPLTGAV